MSDLSRDPKNSDQQGGCAEGDAEKPDESSGQAGVKDTPEQSRHPTEKEHRSAEQKHWLVQNVVASLGLAFAIVAAGGAGTSAFYAARALTASQESAKAAWQAVAQATLAVAEAKRQADYAEQALGLAKESAADAQHPLIEARFSPNVAQALHAGEGRQVGIAFHNAGPGVAYSIYAEMALWSAPFPAKSFSDLPAVIPNPVHNDMSMAANNADYRLTPMSQSFSQADIDNSCASCSNKFYLYGTVHYTDAKGSPYHKNYCVYIIDESDLVNSYAYCAFHNDVGPD